MIMSIDVSLNLYELFSHITASLFLFPFFSLLYNLFSEVVNIEQPSTTS